MTGPVDAVSRNAAPRPTVTGNNDGVVRLEDFGAVAVKGADRGNQAHAGANVAAFKKYLAALPPPSVGPIFSAGGTGVEPEAEGKIEEYEYVAIDRFLAEF